MKFRNYCLTKETDELKKLILENPDLPIVVLAGEEANGGGASVGVLQQHFILHR